MECRQGRRETPILPSPLRAHSTPQKSFSNSQLLRKRGEGCDGGIFLDPSFLLASSRGLSRACSHLLVEYARFRIRHPLLPSPPQPRKVVPSVIHVSLFPRLYWPALQQGYRPPPLSFSSFCASLSLSRSSFVRSHDPFLFSIQESRNGLTDRRIDGQEYLFSRSYWRATISVSPLFPRGRKNFILPRGINTRINVWIFRKIGGEGKIGENFEASVGLTRIGKCQGERETSRWFPSFERYLRHFGERCL